MKKAPRARDIMSRRPVMIRPESTVHEAAQLLLKHKILSVLVVDEYEQFLGVFSQQGCMDALVDAIYDERPPPDISGLVRPVDRTITEDTSLLSIAQIFVMGKNVNPTLPVLRDRKIVGVVSRIDVIRAVAAFIATAPDRETRLLYISALKEPNEAPSFLNE